MGWLAGWAYRKSHVINPASGAGTGYQVQITAYYGSGTDSGANVYLGGRCRTDFGDIRFTRSDGTTPLSYWIESKVDGNYAVFWVKIDDDLSTSAVTIYMYFGNPSATTTSDPFNTFVFYDDFNDYTTSSVTEKGRWAVGADTVFSVDTANKRLVVNNPSGGYGHWIKAQKDGADVVMGNMVIDVDVYNNGGYNELAILTRGQTYPQNDDYQFCESTYDNTWRIVKRQAGATYIIASSTATIITAQWMHWRITLFGSTLKFVSSLGLTTELTATDTAFSSGVLGIITHGNTVSYVDNYRVRKYTSPEPSHGAWGTVEAAIDVSDGLGLKDIGIAQPTKIITALERLGLKDITAAAKTWALQALDKLGMKESAVLPPIQRIYALEKLELNDITALKPFFPPHDRPDYTGGVSIESFLIKKIPIDVVAQTIGKIAVDIVSQTIQQLAISIAAQTVGVSIQAEWQSWAGNLKSLNDYNYGLAPTETRFAIDYTIPSGKRFFIHAFYLSLEQESGYGIPEVHAELLVENIPVSVLHLHSGERNGHISFPVPIALSAGQKMQVRLKNKSATDYVRTYCGILGYETT
jgi:hypothetical protein